jgi:hypothetical protein
MSSAVDEVRFGNNGSEVTMIKWLDAMKNKEAYGSEISAQRTCRDVR